MCPKSLHLSPLSDTQFTNHLMLNVAVEYNSRISFYEFRFMAREKDHEIELTVSKFFLLKENNPHLKCARKKENRNIYIRSKNKTSQYKLLIFFCFR